MAGANSSPKKSEIRAIKKKEWYNQYKKKYTEDAIIKLADDMLLFFETNLDALYFSYFTATFKISKETIHKFYNSNEIFHKAYEDVREILKNRWLVIAAKNENRNHAFAQFMLKNLDDDFRDKQKIELSGEVKTTGIQILLPEGLKDNDKESE